MDPGRGKGRNDLSLTNYKQVVNYSNNVYSEKWGLTGQGCQSSASSSGQEFRFSLLEKLSSSSNRTDLILIEQEDFLSFLLKDS